MHMDHRIQTSFRLPAALWKKFKHALVETGQEMTPVLEKLVRQWVDEQALRQEKTVTPARPLAGVGSNEGSLHRAFLRWVPAVALIRDLDGRLLYANEEFERFTGRSREELLHSLPGNEFPPHIARHITAHEQAVRENKVSVLSVERLRIERLERSADSERMTIRFPIMLGDELTMTGALGFDLKAIRKSALLSRRGNKTYERWQTIAPRYAPAGTLAVDDALLGLFFQALPAIATWKDLGGRMVWANLEYERVTRKTLNEAIGNSPVENWPPEVGEPMMAHDSMVRETKALHLTSDRIVVAGREYERINIRFPIFGHDWELEKTASLGIDLRIITAGAALLEKTPSGESSRMLLTDCLNN
jgi:PAS domain-containing protein